MDLFNSLFSAPSLRPRATPLARSKSDYEKLVAKNVQYKDELLSKLKASCEAAVRLIHEDVADEADQADSAAVSGSNKHQAAKRELTQDLKEVHDLCEAVEACLYHGIRAVGGQAEGMFWEFLQAMSKAEKVATSTFQQDCMVIRQLRLTTAPTQGRAWVRLCLNQHFLADYVRWMIRHQSVLRKWYDPFALLLDTDCVLRFTGFLDMLDTIPFRCNVNDRLLRRPPYLWHINREGLAIKVKVVRPAVGGPASGQRAGRAAGNQPSRPAVAPPTSAGGRKADAPSSSTLSKSTPDLSTRSLLPSSSMSSSVSSASSSTSSSAPIAPASSSTSSSALIAPATSSSAPIAPASSSTSSSAPIARASSSTSSSAPIAPASSSTSSSAPIARASSSTSSSAPIAPASSSTSSSAPFAPASSATSASPASVSSVSSISSASASSCATSSSVLSVPSTASAPTVSSAVSSVSSPSSSSSLRSSASTPSSSSISSSQTPTKSSPSSLSAQTAVATLSSGAASASPMNTASALSTSSPAVSSSAVSSTAPVTSPAALASSDSAATTVGALQGPPNNTPQSNAGTLQSSRLPQQRLASYPQAAMDFVSPSPEFPSAATEEVPKDARRGKTKSGKSKAKSGKSSKRSKSKKSKRKGRRRKTSAVSIAPASADEDFLTPSAPVIPAVDSVNSVEAPASPVEPPDSHPTDAVETKAAPADPVPAADVVVIPVLESEQVDDPGEFTADAKDITSQVSVATDDDFLPHDAREPLAPSISTAVVDDEAVTVPDPGTPPMVQNTDNALAVVDSGSIESEEDTEPAQPASGSPGKADLVGNSTEKSALPVSGRTSSVGSTDSSERMTSPVVVDVKLLENDPSTLGADDPPAAPTTVTEDYDDYTVVIHRTRPEQAVVDSAGVGSSNASSGVQSPNVPHTPPRHRLDEEDTLHESFDEYSVVIHSPLTAAVTFGSPFQQQAAVEQDSPSTQSSSVPAPSTASTSGASTPSQDTGATGRAGWVVGQLPTPEMDIEYLRDYFESSNEAKTVLAPWHTPAQNRRHGGAGRAPVTIAMIVKRPGQRLSHKELYIRQSGKCATCYQRVSKRQGLLGNTRYCRYTEKLHCQQCHVKQKRVIPSRLVFNMDKKPSLVCRLAAAYLDAVHDVPMLAVADINPQLYETCEELRHVHQLRGQLQKLSAFVMTCNQRDKLIELFGSRRYLLREDRPDDVGIDMYSIRDLLDTFSGKWAKELSELIEKLSDHITNGACPICQARGWFCEYCNDPTPIYSFQTRDIIQCSKCRAVYHSKCFRPSTCPKCLRLNQRRASIDSAGATTAGQSAASSSSVEPVGASASSKAKRRASTEQTGIAGALATFMGHHRVRLLASANAPRPPMCPDLGECKELASLEHTSSYVHVCLQKFDACEDMSNSFHQRHYSHWCPYVMRNPGLEASVSCPHFGENDHKRLFFHGKVDKPS